MGVRGGDPQALGYVTQDIVFQQNSKTHKETIKRDTYMRKTEEAAEMACERDKVSDLTKTSKKPLQVCSKN